MIDSLVGLFVLVMGALSYLSLATITSRSQGISSEDSKAAQMTARLLEQIQLLKPADLNTQTLASLNLIDADDDASPYSITQIPLDEGTHYSPKQALRNGAGTLTITNLTYGSVRAEVEITWTSPTGKTKSFKSGTIVGGYR
jgi:Tfp pilus assembly protein PilV